MEVKPGYKQTEVGVIPEEWDVEPLGKRAAFRTGPFGSALHKSDYTSNGIPVVNPMHIIDGKIEPTRSMTITEQAARNLSDFRMKPCEIGLADGATWADVPSFKSTNQDGCAEPAQ